ncbi:MAG: DNA polymerase III subunit delta' [Chromatiaceae bacterium]|nr:DNA polymerase III subunit delta' [Chromatiaceae bacterium]
MSAVGPFPWHAAQWQRVAAARNAGRLPHSLLLAGPAGLGKAAFARRLSDALVCTQAAESGDACGACPACRLSRAGSHPDQHVLAPEEPGKMIRIDAVRELTTKSVLAAQAGGYRVFILDPAEQMNRAAANALLKTLEEPVSRSVLILVSSHPDRLPATIRSRCQTIKFTLPSADQVRACLQGRAEPSEFDELLAVSGGSPLRALQALEQGWIGEGRRLILELTALRQRKTNPLQIVEEWEKRPLTLVFDGLKRCVSDLVRLASGMAQGAIYHPGLRADLQSLGRGIDLQKLFLFNDELLQIERDAARNLNVQMMFEHIANLWLQITRPGGQ